MRVLMTLPLLALAACSGGSTGSGTLGAQSAPPVVLGANGGTVSLVQGGGYTYAVTPVASGANTTADVVDGLSVILPPASGSAVMSGTYNARIMPDVLVNVTEDLRDQPISLTADFGAGTLTGTDGTLTVDGSFTGIDMAGTVTLRGMSGELAGAVGSDQAIGVFQGQGGNTIFAGGFYALDQ